MEGFRLIKRKLRILMVEDQIADAQLAEQVLRKGGFDFTFKCVDSEDAFVKELKDFRPSAILSDHGLCAFDGFSALALAQVACPDVPFIFVTGSLGEEMATKALKSGASDFILKHHMKTLAPALHRALREAHSQVQRKKAEQEIHRLNEELEHRVARRTADLEAANAELEAFSYSVAHELRAPLRQIEGYIQILSSSRSSPKDEESTQCLTAIASSAQRLGQLIEDLLAFSKATRAGMRKGKVDLNSLCQSVIRELGGEMSDRAVEWHIHDLPTITGDVALLRQVMANLLGNAVKYTRREKSALIEVSSYRTEEDLVVFVRDNGGRVRHWRYVNKLFGVFQRLHQHSEFEGTGIGLANVRRIIHQHQGRTWAEGKPNHGATFYFSLPLPRGAAESTGGSE